MISREVETKKATVVKKVYIPTTYTGTKGCPVGIWADENGVLKAIPCAISNTARFGNWGVLTANVASISVGEAVVQGAVSIAGTLGTAGQLLTALTAAGSATGTALASGTVVASAIGVCTDTGVIIY